MQLSTFKTLFGYNKAKNQLWMFVVFKALEYMFYVKLPGSRVKRRFTDVISTLACVCSPFLWLSIVKC